MSMLRGLLIALALQAPALLLEEPGRTELKGRTAPTEAPAAKDPVRFEFELLPALTQSGCNSGACHGSPHGRGGFALSLFAYDPDADHATLLTGALGRRLDLIDPEASLLLRKPLGQVPHGGGVRLREGDVSLTLIKRWLGEGAAGPNTAGVTLEALEIEPKGPVLLTLPDAVQALSARARLSDDTALDVTPIVSWFSTDEAIATVDADGRVTGKGRGQCAIVARYLDRLESVPFVFVQPVEGYAWSAPEARGFIDQLVNERLRDLQYLPAATCDDATFLRRVQLDLTGLLPTPDEARAFLSDPSPEKREAAIDRLLASDEHAAFWGNKTADLLRLTKAQLGDDAAPYARLIRESWLRNEPYDAFVRGLLTSTDAGASYFRALKDANTRTEATTQVFLGSRLECAKCHNHPYEGWTQDDYYRIATNFSDGVEHARTKAPSAPWSGPAGAPLVERRAAFAEWLTREDERFFARVEVNRLWAALMGRGIVEPVDDFRSSNPPSNPALLDALAAEFKHSGYDRRHMLRAIARSQTYQRRSEPTDHDEPNIELFSRQRQRLLDAEQLSDGVARVAREAGRRARLEAAQSARQQANARAVALDDGFERWVDETRAALLAGGGAAFGPWSASRAFGADDAFERDFGVEARASAPLTFDGAGWEPHPEWQDGAPHSLAMPARSALYLSRLVTATAPCRVELSLGSDDGLRLWVAGREVLTRNVSRGVAPDQDKVTVELPSGQSQVLLKIWNGGGAAGFYFKAADTIDARLVELLDAHDAGRLGQGAQHEGTERELWSRYLVGDEGWRALDQEARTIEAELDGWFATQRLVPDAEDAAADRTRATFLAAFGAPPRATSCACERSNEPTLAQALQMLNGAFVGARVVEAARHYRALPDGFEALYLAALARPPSDRERGLLAARLADDSLAAWEDVVWAVLNTKEFLFQH
ncbi:MAG: DUF1553 domain-containing protein [Planctomycetota bacterium]